MMRRLIIALIVIVWFTVPTILTLWLFPCPHRGTLSLEEVKKSSPEEVAKAISRGRTMPSSYKSHLSLVKLRRIREHLAKELERIIPNSSHYYGAAFAWITYLDLLPVTAGPHWLEVGVKDGINIARLIPSRRKEAFARLWRERLASVLFWRMKKSAQNLSFEQETDLLRKAQQRVLDLWRKMEVQVVSHTFMKEK